MKGKFLVAVVVFASICIVAASAQQAPNLENGFKNYGSYDGSHLDTVNLMNGNLMLHVPLLPAYAQRGSFAPQYSLYMTSKGWQTQCKPMSTSSTGEVCWWQTSGAGVMVISGEGLLIQRTLLRSLSGTGQTLYNMQNYTVTGPDASVHRFMAVPGAPLAPTGDPTVYESMDASGYHIVISNPDLNGVMSGVTVTDRQGRQYTGNFNTDYSSTTGCGRPGIVGIPQVGNYAPVTDDVPFGDQYCPQWAPAQQVTDSNGNQMQFGITRIDPPLLTDTLGRSMPFTFAPASPATADPAKCVMPATGAFSATDLIYYNAPDGTTHYLQRCYASMPIQTAFGIPDVAEAPNSLGSFPVPDHLPLLVTLIQADGTKWVFNYDTYANLTYVGLPTGGSISYAWETVAFPSCWTDRTSVSRAVQSRVLTDNNGHSTTWTYNWGALAGNLLTNTVTDPAGNDTVHVFTALDGGVHCALYETSTRYYQGPQAGAPRKQVDTEYPPLANLVDDGLGHLANVVPISLRTTVNPSGKVSLITKQYDTGYGPGTTIFGNVVKEQEYDWGQGAPGPLLRETDTVYKWQKDGNYLTAGLLDLPASTITISAAGPNPKTGCPVTPSTTANCVAETDYAYDEPGYLTAANVSTQHAAPPGPVRGNLTTTGRWLSTTNSFVSSHTNWYDTGEPYQQLDPLGHTTTLTYDPAYINAYVTRTCSPSTGGTAHCVSGTYDFNTGVLTSLTNENATAQAVGNTPGDSAHTASFTYDAMFRVTSAQAPPDPANGGLRAFTSFSYSTSALPVSITRQKSITPLLTDSATNTFDGLARIIRSQHAMPSGPPSTVDTAYDDQLSTVTVTNPYYNTTESTYGTTATLSDALGRPTQITEQDGSLKTVSYDVVAPAGTLGNCTLTTDEASKHRRSCSDALGRLVEVDESGAPYAGNAAGGNVIIGGNLQSISGVGAHGIAYASAQVTVSGTDHVTTVIPICPRGTICDQTPETVYDSGKVYITVNGHEYDYWFGSGGAAADTSASVAQGIVNAIQADPARLVNASVPAGGTIITLTAVTAGSAGNSITVATGWTWDTVDFPTQGASFTATINNTTSGTLANGQDAYPGQTIYDAGAVSISVGGYSATANYGSGAGLDSDAASVAADLVAKLQAQAPPFSASVPPGGTQITINWNTPSAAGNVAVSVTSSTSQTAYFSLPSFVGCGTSCPAPTSNPQSYAAALTGGQDPAPPGLDHNYYVTLYIYDALGNLLCVEQHGDVSGTGCASDPSLDAASPWRVRRFTYDSLSRLLTARNPESGTITYSYDADGNLLQKTSPAPNQTGTATQTISYCYDELHRLTGKAYSAQSCPLASPAVTYSYDSGANARGHLTSLTDQAGSASYGYDVLGRMASETRVISGVSKTISYEYNLDGSLAKLHYPSGAVVTYAPDSAGRLTQAVDAGNSINYVTSASYQADGQMTGFVNGGLISNAFSYNKRLQPINMSASTTAQTVFSIGYDFHVGNGTNGVDNGNVWSIYNYRDRTRDQSFTYDPLNRLTSAQNAGTNCAATTVNGKTEYWGNTYGYDAWGNLTQKAITKCGAENLSLSALVNNQLSGYGYDAAGNMTSDPTDHVTSTYDPENRIATALTPQGTFSYVYDADGNRVEKTGGGTATLYWYMTPGIVGESDLAGVMKSEYIFFNGERVARRDLVAPGGVFYYFSDHLKTASVITDSAGNIKSESGYYPWGGELQFVNNDSNHYKFTGKERDTESGLDYFGARYYSNGLGRFISTDWSAIPEPVPYADFANPQTLNLYHYPSNPETFPDIDGHQSLASQRQAAVRDAWKQEQARVAAGKPGTVNWNAAERTELLQTGKVSGYVGHHINSVNGHPELARDPNNIKFVKGTEGNLAEHGGDFRNVTSGKLMNRAFVAVQLIGALIQAWGDYKFNQYESKTGLHSDALFGIRVSNVEKAAQTLAPGTEIKTNGGEVFTLGKDHVFMNYNGDTLYFDPKDNKNHIKRSGCC